MKTLEQIRDELADYYTDEELAGAEIDEEHVHTAFKSGFDACAKSLREMSPEFESKQKTFFSSPWYKNAIEMLSVGVCTSFVVPINSHINQLIDEIDQCKMQIAALKAEVGKALAKADEMRKNGSENNQ